MAITTALLIPPFFHSTRPYSTTTTTTTTTTRAYLPSLTNFRSISLPLQKRARLIVHADDGDAESGGPDDYDMEDEEVEELDNKKDYDVEYEPVGGSGSVDADIAISMVDSKSFVDTQGWDSEMVVDYKIDEDEFHKISLMECDFFIRKPPDPDSDVYDFREVFYFVFYFLNIINKYNCLLNWLGFELQMYVTPPDTDIYAIPKVLAPMPQKVTSIRYLT